jgi:hypothetical protein
MSTRARYAATAIAALCLCVSGCNQTTSPTEAGEITTGTSSASAGGTTSTFVPPTQPPLNANVIAISYQASNRSADVIVAVPQDIDSSARQGKGDSGIQVTIHYVSLNNTVEAADSGRKSIRNDTTSVGRIDSKTVSVQIHVPIGTAAVPGSLSATAQIFSSSDDDDISNGGNGGSDNDNDNDDGNIGSGNNGSNDNDDISNGSNNDNDNESNENDSDSGGSNGGNDKD